MEPRNAMLLFTQKCHPRTAEIFETECFGSAIIDTACTRIVCEQQL